MGNKNVPKSFQIKRTRNQSFDGTPGKIAQDILNKKNEKRLIQKNGLKN